MLTKHQNSDGLISFFSTKMSIFVSSTPNFKRMKSSKLFIITIALLCFTNIIAQPYFQFYDSVQVRIGGNYVANPWAGGLNFVQISDIDMNMDGIKDLFVFDRTGNKIRTFINNGTPNTVDYTYNPYYETKFPKLQEWALLVDFNCDGKDDIFSYSSVGGGIDIYKNVSTVATGLQFQKIVTQVKSIYNPPAGMLINLYVSSVDIPAIVDIDNDGDLDVVTFAITGTYMEYHKNMSMELYGVCDSLKFQMANRCWGYASEHPLSNDYTLHDTCVGNVSNPELGTIDGNNRDAERHSGSCQLCIDLDNDGDKEFIVGDVSFPNLTMLTNGGTLTSASFVAKDTAFPKNNLSTVPINLTLFPCAYYEDVNNDGVKDLLVSPNAPNASENFNSIVYYKNIGTNSSPIFQYQQSNLLQDQMIDLGEGAYPVFFDYDNDGLKDLFVGNYGYYSSGGTQYRIAQFKNIGTPTQPKFDLITRDYNNYGSLGISNMVPTFGDLDGDGDADMIIGAGDGRLHYFRNIAPIGSTANFVLAQANFKNSSNRVIDIGDVAVPQIVDIDNDGKNDLVVGRRNGKIAYFHHSGTGTAPIPVMDSVTYSFGNVSVNLPGYFTGYSAPFFFKQGGQTKLLCGAESGYLNLYDHIDGNLTGTFTRVDSTYLNVWQGTRSAPFGSDINNDGLMDLIVGNYQGGLSFYKGTSSLITVHDIDPNEGLSFDIYPNPANNYVNIRINTIERLEYTLEIYDMLGQIVFTEMSNQNLIVLNTEQIKNGIYICKINIKSMNNDKRLTKRMVIHR